MPLREHGCCAPAQGHNEFPDLLSPRSQKAAVQRLRRFTSFIKASLARTGGTHRSDATHGTEPLALAENTPRAGHGQAVIYSDASRLPYRLGHRGRVANMLDAQLGTDKELRFSAARGSRIRLALPTQHEL